MLECWRHSAVRRPSFIQLLDQLAADLSDEFRNVSYYFNHEPDYDNDDAASDDGSTDSRIVTAEDVNEMVPFRAKSSGQPRPELSVSTSDSKVSDSRNVSTRNELPSSSFVGRSSTDQKPPSAEFIEMSSPLNVTAETGAGSSLQADVHVDEERLQRNRQQDSHADSVRDSDSKDSSGNSLGSCRNGLIKGHIIPLHSEVH